eukprot:9008716-Lingulodinium_polyedra.AAC.1
MGLRHGNGTGHLACRDSGVRGGRCRGSGHQGRRWRHARAAGAQPWAVAAPARQDKAEERGAQLAAGARRILL